MIYVLIPLKKDWPKEIKKKGEKRVPAISDEAKAFIRVRSINDRGFRSKAKRIAIFPRPMRKKGVNLGRSISA